jgi:photosystem II stability/assembly factor-like uncharacterized protein
MKSRFVLAFILAALLLLGATAMVASAKASLELRELPKVAAQAPGLAWSGELDATADFSPTWTTGGPVGGAVYAVAVDPEDSDNVFAGMYRSGVRRSTDGGTTWDDTPIDADAQHLDPGEGYANIVDVTTAPGVVYAMNEWKMHTSVDGGETWSHQSFPSGYFGDLEVHPSLTKTLYLAGQGVYSSANGGQNWTVITNGIPSTFINDVEIDPTNPVTMYVGARDNHVYKTTDGGATWSDSSTGLPTTEAYVWDVAVNPVTPTLVYAVTEGEGVYRSEDGGANWSSWSDDGHYSYSRAVMVDPSGATVFVGSDGCGLWARVEGGGDWISLGPDYTTGERRVWTITVPEDDTVFIGIYGDGVYKSTDGGSTWTGPGTSGFNAVGVNHVRAHPTDPDIAYATAYGGLYHTDDGGQSWDRVRESGTTTSLGQDSYGLEINANGKVIVGMRSHIITSTNGTDWFDASSGLGSDSVKYIAADPNVPSTLFAGLCCSSDGGERGVYRSTDGGAHHRYGQRQPERAAGEYGG